MGTRCLRTQAQQGDSLLATASSGLLAGLDAPLCRCGRLHFVLVAAAARVGLLLLLLEQC